MTELQCPFDNIECEGRVNGPQDDIQTFNVYQKPTESVVRQQLIEVAEGKGQNLNELNSRIQEELVESQSPRRSIRPRNPTGKMATLQEENAQKKERRLISAYEKWKMLARTARNQLKSDLTESQLASLIDILENEKEIVMQIYKEVRNLVTPSTGLRRRIDACEAVKSDIIKIAYERISGLDEFDEKQVKQRLQELLDCSYARSIYGSTVSRISHKPSKQLSHHTVSSHVASRHAEAAAELADLRVAQARFKAYNQMVIQEIDSSLVVGEQHCPSRSSSNKLIDETSSPSQNDVPSLVQVLHDSINLNRLPTPEPFVFNGDSIQYIEWKASFVSLIDKKMGGAARKTLDGTFYRSDDEAYKDAWNKLDKKYGQPFIIQRAFRQKLANWLKIQQKDAVGLREFSDFLNACHDAMPHVEGLQILNDCEENQKLVQKLPEWAASRWNRQVTQNLRDKKSFPAFKAFAAFVSLEAEVVCNPVTSSYALSLGSAEKSNVKEGKGNKVNVFNTQAVLGMDKPRVHQLNHCHKLMTKTLEERRKYVKENNLCYGCLKHGHAARNCHYRLFCNTCKGKHPTCLHDDGYTRRERPVPKARSAQNPENESTAVLSLSVASERSSYTSMVVPVWIIFK
ncbi:hypothetical protein IRJ41_014552 [Triplophysa rosa]|uniref:CCHC-type domain-containing protein n=1 Tax=Triplophysa rosa TaxID=992332 RepID=A0A9W7X640_TRIRA|nr:hypothetical protein IRJ41_014552 [Triplophysa rosa]